MQTKIPIIVISDCRDDNAKNRVLVRLASLFPGAATHFIGVNDDLDAGGNLIDVLDALDGQPGIIIVNAAPRGGDHSTRWRNGSPFGTVTIDGTIVVATLAGYTLSFAKKLGLPVSLNDVREFDLQQVLEAQLQSGRFERDEIDRVTRTQFRSFEFAPRLAKWLKSGRDLPSVCPQRPVADLPLVQRVWWVDNFGNLKTTALPRDLEWREGEKVLIKKDQVVCYPRLSDVPDQSAGLVIGSSGYGDQRFVELVVKGDSAARRFGLNVGDEIFHCR
jgi:hypothetical protein